MSYHLKTINQPGCNIHIINAPVLSPIQHGSGIVVISILNKFYGNQINITGVIIWNVRPRSAAVTATGGNSNPQVLQMTQ